MAFVQGHQWRLELDIGTAGEPEWAAFAGGVQTYGQSIKERSSSYYYIGGDGAPEVVSEGVAECFAVVGHRNIGDRVQDWLFDHRRVWNREAGVRRAPYRYYNLVDGRGEQGTVSISYTTTGSGGAGERSAVGLVLDVEGVPEAYQKRYGVTYDPGEGEGAVVDAGRYLPGEEAVVLGGDGLELDGAAFACWNTAPEGGGSDVEPGDRLVMRDDVVLYAVWRR